MTIIFTSVTPRYIVMTVDSAVTNSFLDHNEYKIGGKSYPIQGIGLVATWGERTGNRIGELLRNRNPAIGAHSISDLRNLVSEYLENDFQPHESDLGEVGYHIAGFDENGQPHFYQILYATKNRKPGIQDSKECQNYDSTPPPKTLRLAYDGRFNLAHKLVTTLIEEVNEGKDVRYDVSNPIGLVQFNDFVIRFVGELTPEVGPPFITYIVNSSNEIELITNNSFTPLGPKEIYTKLTKLGLVASEP